MLEERAERRQTERRPAERIRGRVPIRGSPRDLFLTASFLRLALAPAPRARAGRERRDQEADDDQDQ
jgi:hypothetical protein